VRVFEKKKGQKRLFGLKRYEVTGEKRKLYEQLHSLYTTSSLIKVTKLTMRWVEHVAHMWR
jgi:hypothetical protein